MLFISSEMSEVVRVSHRIAVLRDRRKVGGGRGHAATEDQVYRLIAGAAASHERAIKPRFAASARLAGAHARAAAACSNLSSNAQLPLIAVLDGHLFGSPIDILNRAAPLVLVALGMTLVIATRGIDISVGAVVAIAGAAAASDRRRADDPRAGSAASRCRWRSRRCGVLCGMWNGLLVACVGMQPIIATLILMVAGRGVAQLLTGGQIIPIDYRALLRRQRLSGSACRSRCDRRGGRRGALLLDEAHRARPVHPRDRHQSGRDATGRRARERDRVCGLRVLRACGGASRAFSISSNVRSADGNNAGLLLELDAILAVTLGGTSLLGGRFSLAGTVLGALIIQTLTYTIYSIGVPPEVNLVVKAAVVFVVSVHRSRADCPRGHHAATETRLPTPPRESPHERGCSMSEPARPPASIRVPADRRHHRCCSA